MENTATSLRPRPDPIPLSTRGPHELPIARSQIQVRQVPQPFIPPHPRRNAPRAPPPLPVFSNQVHHAIQLETKQLKPLHVMRAVEGSDSVPDQYNRPS